MWFESDVKRGVNGKNEWVQKIGFHLMNYSMRETHRAAMKMSLSKDMRDEISNQGLMSMWVLNSVKVDRLILE